AGVPGGQRPGRSACCPGPTLASSGAGGPSRRGAVPQSARGNGAGGGHPDRVGPPPGGWPARGVLAVLPPPAGSRSLSRSPTRAGSLHPLIEIQNLILCRRVEHGAPHLVRALVLRWAVVDRRPDADVEVAERLQGVDGGVGGQLVAGLLE